MQTLVKLLFEFSLQNTKNWIFAEIRWKNGVHIHFDDFTNFTNFPHFPSKKVEKLLFHDFFKDFCELPKNPKNREIRIFNEKKIVKLKRVQFYISKMETNFDDFFAVFMGFILVPEVFSANFR